MLAASRLLLPISAGTARVPDGAPLALAGCMEMPGESTVLVVEDDGHALAGYVEFFARARFRVSGCGSGGDALRLALDSVPDVVVTDVMLPGLDGFELSAALRAEPRTRNVPIIGMTGHWSPAIQLQAQRVGMSTVLLKPCSPSHLLAEVQRVLRHARLLTAALGNVTVGEEPALPVGLRNAVRRRHAY